MLLDFTLGSSEIYLQNMEIETILIGVLHGSEIKAYGQKFLK